MKKNLPVACFFLIFSAILIFSWFRAGFIYGGGDVGLPVYDPQRILHLAKYVWWEGSAPGYPVPQGLTSAPLLLLLSFFQNLNFSPVALQATLFFALLFLMGFGMYLLALSVLGDEKKVYALVAGIFYMLNPYMMIQVWHRFVHTSMILASALPLMMLFWRFWLKTQRMKFLLLFLLTNFLAVYLFGTIGFILTVWILLFLITFLESVIPWKNLKQVVQGGLLFGIGLVLWLLTNSWWLIPTFTVGSALFGEQHTTDESLLTLLEISRQQVLPHTLQMINPFYLFETAELGDLYKNLLFKAIPWVFVAIILLGLIKSLFDRKFAHFGLLFLISLFLAKGAASPLGYPYILAFSNFFALGVIRNPFEKLGIALALFASILFATGMLYLHGYFKHKIYRIFLSIILLVLVVVFSWPMFLGTIFGRVDKPAFIKVPQEYVQANDWLKLQGKSGKILHLPLPRGEAVSYNWQYGYNGVEPSNLFFTSNPSISRGLNIKHIDDALTSLSLAFHPRRDFSENKIVELLRAFNVRFIILHKDVKFEEGELANPEDVEKMLGSLQFLNKKAQFGDLLVYEISEQYYQPKIVISDDILLVSPAKTSSQMHPWLVSDNTSAIITQLNDEYDGVLQSHSSKIVVFPKSNFSFPETATISLENSLNQLASTQNFTTNSPIFDLLVAMQYLDILKASKSEQNVGKKIFIASQDLVKMYQLISSQQEASLLPVVKEYTQLIDEIFSKQKRELKLYSQLKEPDEIFKMHLLILLDIQTKLKGAMVTEIQQSIAQIKKFLEEKNLLPTYQLVGFNTDIGQRQVFHFWIPSRGRYELLMVNPQIQGIYEKELKQLNFQINDRPLTLAGKRVDQLLSFGELDLQDGLLEISYGSPASVNLTPNLKDTTKVGNIKLNNDGSVEIMTSANKPSFIEANLNPIVGGDIYQVVFELMIQSGKGFKLEILQNNDRNEKEGKKPRIGYFVAKNPYNTQWLKYNFNLAPLSSTVQEAKIRLTVEPENILLSTSGSVLFKNLKVTRVLNNGIFLRSEGSKEITDSQQFVQFNQKTSIYYDGVINLSKPTFLFFKEAYHPGWELQLIRGNEVYKPDKRYLAYMYGNAWFIDKEGEYKFKLEFKPQQRVTLGLYLAGIGWLIAVLLWGGAKFKKTIWKPSD